MSGERWLIVGLGNPGPGYAANRHNAGYMVADVLAERTGAHFRAGKFQAGPAKTFSLRRPVKQLVGVEGEKQSRLLGIFGDQEPAEVMNFDGLGYSSFQGVLLLKSRVLPLAPDVLVIGFGMNDSEVAGYRDKDMVATARPGVATRLKDTGKDLEFYNALPSRQASRTPFGRAMSSSSVLAIRRDPAS